MPEYLAPGVYVEEVDTGSKPIEGVSTSTAGMIGVTERGPVNVPILITSYGEFRRWFGDEIPAASFFDHRYLPHAVNGFFTNGGKRLYLTRVIDTALARRSALSLFYDGVAGAGSTVLLRASAEFTGSAANPPPLVALSSNNLAANDWVRIGDGSGAEYRQIATIVSPDTVVVPLHLPFARAHTNAAPIRQFTLGAGVGGAFDLIAAAALGATTLNIEGAAADIDALANNQLLQIDGALGEFRFIRDITNVADAAPGRRTARITLNAPLTLTHTAAPNTIVRFAIPAAPPNPVQISPASASGAAVVFVNNRGGAFNTRTDLVIVDEGNADRQEVRRIGELHQATLGAGITLGCGAGTVVTEVALVASDAIQVQGTPAPTATTFAVNDVTRLTIGQRVLIGPDATPRAVNTITSGAANTGTLAVAPALAAAPAVGHFVVPVRQLTASATRGATFLALDNRLGLTAGDVLRITSAGDEEYVVIDTLPNPAAPGVRPDAGMVVLNQPLSRDYAVATTEIVQLRAPIAGALLPGSSLRVQAAPPPTTTTFGLDDVTRLTFGQFVLVGSGAAAVPRTISNVTPGAGNTGTIAVNPTLASAPAAGETVVPVFPSLLPSDTRRVQGPPAPAPTITTFDLNDVTRLTPGQFLLVGSGAAAAPRTISNIALGAGSAGTVTVTPALALQPAVGDAVALLVPSPVASNALVVQGPPAPAPTITTFDLNDVTRLTPGQLLLVGSGALAVPRTISGITPGAGSAGTVTVTPALAVAPGAGSAVVPIIPVVPSLQPTVIALGVAPGGSTLLLADGSGYTAANRFISLRTPEGEVSYHRITALAATAVPVMIDLTNFLTRAHPVGSPVAERLQLLDVEALDVGAWGDRLRISVENEANGLSSTTLRAVVVVPNQIRLASLAGIEPGTVLEMRSPDGTQVIGGLLKVQSVDRTTGVLTLQAPGLDPIIQQPAITALPAGQAMGLVSREFRLRVELLRRPDPLVPARDTTVIQQEDFRLLSMDPRHSRYTPRLIGSIGGPLRRSDRRPEGDSWLIRVRDASNAPATQQGIRVGPETLIDVLPDGRTQAARHPLSGGDDSIGTLKVSDYVGQEDPNPELRTGLQSLRNIEEISIVGAPGNTLPEMQNALINHCELMRYRFAVLDGMPPPRDAMADIQAQRQQFDTKYAALYHPWLTIPDPFPTIPGPVPDYPIPPSGHMLGVYARTDIERGVHKAPANEVVRGIIGLQRLLNKEQHDILNPYPVNINVIRDFRNNNRGIRVYGGRVITSDSDWKYVNVRRLLIFIEASIDRGLQWVVFEPNAEPLWARVRRSISNFLTLVWRNGGLEGTKVEEAYFVKCDRTTMTQTDIDSGRLIIVVGVAPVKPAEFVIVRIGLWTAHAED